MSWDLDPGFFTDVGSGTSFSLEGRIRVKPIRIPDTHYATLPPGLVRIAHEVPTRPWTLTVIPYTALVSFQDMQILLSYEVELKFILSVFKKIMFKLRRIIF